MQSKHNSKRNSLGNNAKKNTGKFIIPPLDENIEIELIEPYEDNGNDGDDVNLLMKYVNVDASSDSMKWSRMDEKTVNKYIQKAIGYKTLYNDTYFIYMFYNNLIKYPLIVLTAISIVMQTIFATIVQSTTPNICNCTSDAGIINNAGIFSITTASVSAIVSILTYVHSSFAYGTIAQGSRDAAVAFSEFADDLRTLLSFPRHIRANPFTVINTIQSDYKRLLKTYSKYPIPVSVYHKFARNSKNKHIISDIVDNTDADQFDLHDGELERNIITEKFIDNIRNIRNAVPAALPTERFTRRNSTIDLRNKSDAKKTDNDFFKKSGIKKTDDDLFKKSDGGFKKSQLSKTDTGPESIAKPFEPTEIKSSSRLPTPKSFKKSSIKQNQPDDATLSEVIVTNNDTKN
jgi:hypothetical protein